MNEITKNNKAVILQTIISANQNLENSLKKKYPKLNSKELNTALLLLLDYSLEEIRILLDLNEDAITEMYDLLMNNH